jgi:glycolate oxidase iron-sulfur subunit
MQTHFSVDQLESPTIREMDAVLRKCVHCGFCLSACPTYSILGDERDSPRGRIYLIKDMLETDGQSLPQVRPHVDKCLSCLACTSVCPSGVDYGHYVDYARAYVDEKAPRPALDNLIRGLLAKTIPNPRLFRLSLLAGRLGKPFAGLFGKKLGALLKMAPGRLPSAESLGAPGVYPAMGERVKRVALLAGCAQQVLRPAINAATIRLLNRLGCEVVVSASAGCCGALVHHMGRAGEARAFAAANIDAWMLEVDGAGLDAIVVNASGCGTEVKDYGHLFKDDAAMAEKAAKTSALTKDISEVLADLAWPSDLPGGNGAAEPVSVAYHDPCSLLHGQKISAGPRALLQAAGFQLQEIPGQHFCCGSAGAYNLLQDELASRLKDRRQAAIRKTNADVLATGNIGCQVQLQDGLDMPVVHTVELLDWASGGPKPAGL